jgi:hypothetical protein
MDMKQRQTWTPGDLHPRNQSESTLLISDVLLHPDQLLLAGTRLNLLLAVQHGGEGGQGER